MGASEDLFLRVKQLENVANNIILRTRICEAIPSLSYMTQHDALLSTGLCNYAFPDPCCHTLCFLSLYEESVPEVLPLSLVHYVYFPIICK
jgi:hypothetical protein